MDLDVIILGAGPAGITAGIYCTRAGLKTLIIEKGTPGGQAALTDVIENYPGFPGGISGPELMARFARQAAELGVETKNGAVTALSGEPGSYIVKAGEETFTAETVIIATGAEPRRLGVPGEKKLTGRGVSYCATCDAAFFRGKKVAVVGGGDTAVQEALFLTKFAAEVCIIHRRDELRAVNILRQRALDNEKISFFWDTVVEEIRGDSKVEAAVLKNLKSGTLSEEQFDGIFIFVGYDPNTEFTGPEINKNDNGYILTDAWLASTAPGIFAAGDVREKFLRQVSTAVGDGALAAMSVEKFLSQKH